MSSEQLETLARFRVLFKRGIGHIKFVGHRLTNREITIASKLLAAKSEKITVDRSFGSPEELNVVLKKLMTCLVQISAPNVTSTVRMLTSCSFDRKTVKLEFNPEYQYWAQIL